MGVNHKHYHIQNASYTHISRYWEQNWQSALHLDEPRSLRGSIRFRQALDPDGNLERECDPQEQKAYCTCSGHN